MSKGCGFVFSTGENYDDAALESFAPALIGGELPWISVGIGVFSSNLA